MKKEEALRGSRSSLFSPLLSPFFRTPICGLRGETLKHAHFVDAPTSDCSRAPRTPSRIEIDPPPRVRASPTARDVRRPTGARPNPTSTDFGPMGTQWSDACDGQSSDVRMGRSQGPHGLRLFHSGKLGHSTRPQPSAPAATGTQRRAVDFASSSSRRSSSSNKSPTTSNTFACNAFCRRTPPHFAYIGLAGGCDPIYEPI